jgi:hypothetical protein
MKIMALFAIKRWVVGPKWHCGFFCDIQACSIGIGTTTTTAPVSEPGSIVTVSRSTRAAVVTTGETIDGGTSGSGSTNILLVFLVILIIKFV